MCFFQISSCHHYNGTHTCIKLRGLWVSGGEWLHAETMNTSNSTEGTNKSWYLSSLWLPYSCADFLLLAIPSKKDHSKEDNFLPSIWRQLRFPQNFTKIWILETNFLFSFQDRRIVFWRNGCVEIIISPPLLFSCSSSFLSSSPRGTNWWRDKGESRDNIWASERTGGEKTAD